MVVRRQIEVSGIVQGVGFRPFVFRLAETRRLTGTIRNTSAGVTIEVQGPDAVIDDFVAHLSGTPPPLSRITEIRSREVLCTAEPGFHIEQSRAGEQVQTLISPDVALCDDCLRELRMPSDRRYRYPFINCTNCGPRFTIVRDIPYDRPSTSMAVFPMCPQCQAEYDDPHNRRFHAQPNACWDCGPQVELWEKDGTRLNCENPVLSAVEGLQAGKIVAVKGLGGFHLAVDGTNPAAVRRLRERKGRVEKPFAIMVPDLTAAGEFCRLDQSAAAALTSIQHPIVLLPREDFCELPSEIAPCQRDLGIFLPYTPLHHLLFEFGRFRALVMTSGNLSEEPIAIDNQEAVRRLNGLADLFLVHNREILLRCDDSVVRPSAGRLQQLRRSRGFVPVPVFLKDSQPAVLAVGGELKNTICLTQRKHAFVSQHIGDLENVESYRFFEEAIRHLKKVLEVEPELIACDLHPGYFSTQWAHQQTGIPVIGVQHHHAHIASCMAENHLEGQVIGIALDGTGYGTDGNIWGGEVLIAGYEDFERAAHLEYVPLPGGAAAIREPWRMAVSYLAHHFGPGVTRLSIPFSRKLEPRKTRNLLRMIDQRINSPLTSSCGRLFDAVAALLGIRDSVNYEAQAAIELEMALETETGAEMDLVCEDAYPLSLTPDSYPWIIGTRPLFEALVADISAGARRAPRPPRFHNGLSHIFAQVADKVRERTGLPQVCLSGGTFNNVRLTESLRLRLERAGFEVFLQNEVPAGDGGLCLGQAMIAAHRLGAGIPSLGVMEHARM
jgi:hydrogenase maturation protein HypF